MLTMLAVASKPVPRTTELVPDQAHVEQQPPRPAPGVQVQAVWVVPVIALLAILAVTLKWKYRITSWLSR